MEFLIYLVLGGFAGTLAGLFGVGGGLLGSALGVLATLASADTQVNFASVLTKFVSIVVISGGLAIVATIIPAGVAARMTPMDAMRPLK